MKEKIFKIKVIKETEITIKAEDKNKAINLIKNNDKSYYEKFIVDKKTKTIEIK